MARRSKSERNFDEEMTTLNFVLNLIEAGRWGSHLRPPPREGRSSGILQGQDSCHQAPRERSIPGSITTLQTARSAQIAKNLHLFGFDEAKFF